MPWRGVGSRVDFSVELGGDDGPRCQALGARTGASCVPDALRIELRRMSTAGIGAAGEAETGLGVGRSGGSLLDVALAFCDVTDVYGSGLFSEGPASDLVYQHWFDARFSLGCRPHACAKRNSSALVMDGAIPQSYRRWGDTLCQPERLCKSHLSVHERRVGIPETESTHDFFFLSELRLYVLEALGLINWVWY